MSCDRLLSSSVHDAFQHDSAYGSAAYTIAPKDSPTFAKIFSATRPKRLLSSKLLVSRANEDIVVKDPQKPTAKRSEYFASKLKVSAITEKRPRTKLPKNVYD